MYFVVYSLRSTNNHLFSVLDMIPFPYESMVDSTLPQVFDMERDSAILESCDPQMVATISNILNATNIDDM